MANSTNKRIIKTDKMCRLPGCTLMKNHKGNHVCFGGQIVSAEVGVFKKNKQDAKKREFLTGDPVPQSHSPFIPNESGVAWLKQCGGHMTTKILNEIKYIVSHNKVCDTYGIWPPKEK